MRDNSGKMQETVLLLYTNYASHVMSVAGAGEHKERAPAVDKCAAQSLLPAGKQVCSNAYRRKVLPDQCHRSRSQGSPVSWCVLTEHINCLITIVHELRVAALCTTSLTSLCCSDADLIGYGHQRVSCLQLSRVCQEPCAASGF